MLPSHGKFPTITMVDMKLLMMPTFDEEIRTIVFSMAPLKALGVDDFHAKFFQAN